ncbi:ABC transporter permease [Labrenzia aggregata]|uniref:ABC transporter permease n=2 Tax=Roseibium aggregatum TaxID=187304 RepID=A0A926S9Q3_9HYPH|nr:ABC transporter permease [Roseibium aggregatum]
MSVWRSLVEVQRHISAEMTLMLRVYAEGGDWHALLAFLPLGIVFGAAHALTPGHSKTLLAAFVAGSGARLRSALRTAMILAATHIGMSVLIVLLALPVLSIAFGDAGRARVLEDLSRGMIGLIGIWLLVSAIRPRSDRRHREGPLFGVFAGLIPCPLTVFVMSYASAHGVPSAGVTFAAMILIGVAFVLAVVAVVAALARLGLASVIMRNGRTLEFAARASLGLTGAAFILVALLQLGRP